MEITPELLKKYMQGKCTEEEAMVVESWHRSPKESVGHVEDIPVPSLLENRIWQNIQQATTWEGDTNKKNPWGNFRILGIAASLLILIGVGTFLFMNSNKNFHTGPGQMSVLTLEDGTKVHLNALTRLTVPNRFRENKREVLLEGEAFFEVIEDKNRPFTVITASSSSRVLGTKFNLKAYDKGKERLTLKEGSIGYSLNGVPENDQIILKPNEQVILMDGKVEHRPVKANDYMAWMSNVLIFNNETLSEITETLERKFDVKIHIDNKELMPEPFKGKFKVQSIDIILEDLSFVMKFDYRKDNETIIIY